METLELSRGYRVFGLAFGVLYPVLIWSLIFIYSFATHGYARHDPWPERVQALFVLFEVAVLSRWLWKPTRRPSSERTIGVILSLGALFAAGWCTLGLGALISVLREEGIGVVIFLPLALIPLPCVVIYGLSAAHAFGNASAISCRERAIADAGWPARRSGLG